MEKGILTITAYNNDKSQHQRRWLTVKSDVTQGVYIVKTASYILPNQAVREEERNGEKDHHRAPEECQNMLTIHPDRVAVAGEADNGPSGNKKDSVSKKHLGSNHDTVGVAPDSEDRSLPPPDWHNANTQVGTPRVRSCDNTREAGLGVR